MSTSKIALALMSGLILTSCAGTKHGEKAQAPQSAKVVQRNYIVRDRSHEEAPQWSWDFMTFNEQKESSPDRFFVGDSGDVNDRMAGCESAKARARQEIAQEMGTFITSKMSETAEGKAVINKMESSGNGVDRNFASILSSEAKSMLPGVQVVSTTWEERDYSQAGGANSVYNCKVLVKLSKKTLEEVVKNTLAKVLNKEQTAGKSDLLKSLSEAPKEFADRTPASN